MPLSHQPHSCRSLAPRQSSQSWGMGTATPQCPSSTLAGPCHCCCPSCHPLSQFRLVVKMALKLLLVFVEYTEPNALLLIRAVNAVDQARGERSSSLLRGPSWGTVSPPSLHVICSCLFSQVPVHGPT